MGLDMYAMAVKFIDGHEEPEVDANLNMEGEHVEDYDDEFCYWRKHPNLHDWMEKLYRDKGGTDFEFNCCSNVELTEADLHDLETAINEGGLPYTQGFFFGESTGDDDEKAFDLKFIADARKAREDGFRIYYTSWW